MPLLWSSLVLANAAPSTLKEAWTLTADIETPESAYYDEGSGDLFISNVAGSPDAKDGKGWIQRVSIDGKVKAAKWIDGLDAPKGIRSFEGKLWVSNIQEMVSIDIASGKIEKRIKIPRSVFLNDVAIDRQGTVYVSDTMTNQIFSIKGSKVSVFLAGEKLESPNGLLVEGDSLMLATWGIGRADDWSTKTPGSLYRINLKTKKMEKVTRAPLGNLDGLEAIAGGGYLVSDWRLGKVFRVEANGTTSEIISGLKSAADMGYVPAKNRIIVPRMSESRVTAYELAEIGI